MNGKKYRDALPLCLCGCGKQVNKFRAKYLPGHHTRGLTGKKTSFFGKTHNTFARIAISEGKKRIHDTNSC